MHDGDKHKQTNPPYPCDVQTLANPFDWGVLLAGIPTVPPALSEYAHEATEAAKAAAAVRAVAIVPSRSMTAAPVFDHRATATAPQRRTRKTKAPKVKVCCHPA